MRWALTALLGIIILLMPVASFAGECGDVNNSGAVNLLDISYLINYLYKGGPEPDCGTGFVGTCGDVNNSGAVNLLDVTYLSNYLYKGGPEPDCGCTNVMDIDGNVYNTIMIGDQCWMAENLKVTHYRNGDPIPHVTDPGTWGGLTTEAYCNYNNNEGNVAVYGRLYNWFAVDDSRNIAPAGWHVASDAEWKQLEMYLGMSQAEADAIGLRGTDEGGKLKETGTTHWASPNTGATNTSGFTALPGGCRFSDGLFDGMGGNANIWSSTEYGSIGAWLRNLNYNRSQIVRSSSSKRSGISVRCVRD